MDSHVSSGPFINTDTQARATWYGVGGVPHVRIDGFYSAVGGGDGCTSRYNAFRSFYLTRMSATGGVSPVSVSGYFSTFEGVATIQATFEKVDAVSLNAVQATLFLVEDDIVYCCEAPGDPPTNIWDDITRAIRNEPVVLANQGDHVTVLKNIPIDPGWNADHLRAIAILQETGTNKYVIQAASLARVLDFTTTFTHRLVSIPQGNGTALFPATVENVGTSADVVTLSVDQAFGWPTDLQVEGDPNWYTTLDVPLAIGQTKEITVRVQTDADKRIGIGTCTIESSNSGRTQPVSLRIFNGSYAILFADDDNGASYSGSPHETNFVNGLNNLGYLWDNWDVQHDHGGDSPTAADLDGFDAVIWQTGLVTTSPLTADDITTLKAYLDGGGRVFLSSMEFLSSQTGSTTFTADYLGIGSWTNNTKAHTVTGVAGDPISDGMTLPLTFPSESLNRVDTVNPAPGSGAFFYSETGNPAAIRNPTASSGRAVFSTILQGAISDTTTAPDNSQTLIERSLAWLFESDLTGVEDGPAITPTRILAVRPNPFHPRTELSFQLSPRAASGPVRLTLVDAGGRLVRTLIAGDLAAGPHQATWDGKDAHGRLLPAGVYFARLMSLDGEISSKLILMK